MATRTKTSSATKAKPRRAPAKSARTPASRRKVVTRAPSLLLDVQKAVTADGIPSNKRLQTWAQAAYEVHHAAHAQGRMRNVPPVQVSLRIVGAAESRKLNREWRDEDHATNVLSFPVGEMPDLDGQTPTLGDLAVCLPIVKREAKAQGISLDAHWAHLMIHGVLHLLGYDHEVERDALVMEACEIAILDSFGYANPYELAL
ncbi:MAG: rRNA maturation RNase YbeY [Steroidobacteraceae bacterium]